MVSCHRGTRVNVEKGRVTPTPIAVIADCTMVIDRGFMVYMMM
jgi:hypothetical protein